MSEQLSSLEIIGEEAKNQLTERLHHFNALDTKAGIVLGFAGVLVALFSNGRGPTRTLGVCLALAASVLSVLAFLPRRFPTLNLWQLRMRYVTSQEEFTLLHLLDARLEMWRYANRILDQKALLLRLALMLLVAAAGAFGGSILWD